MPGDPGPGCRVRFRARARPGAGGQACFDKKGRVSCGNAGTPVARRGEARAL